MVEAPLYIDDTAGINLMDMHAKLRRLQQSASRSSAWWWWTTCS